MPLFRRADVIRLLIVILAALCLGFSLGAWVSRDSIEQRIAANHADIAELRRAVDAQCARVHRKRATFGRSALSGDAAPNRPRIRRRDARSPCRRHQRPAATRDGAAADSSVARATHELRRGPYVYDQSGKLSIRDGGISGRRVFHHRQARRSCAGRCAR